MLVAGKVHLVRFPAASVKNQPPRFTLVGVTLWISTQSEESPSSSNRARVLLAMNSVITTCAARQGFRLERRPPTTTANINFFIANFCWNEGHPITNRVLGQYLFQGRGLRIKRWRLNV